MAVSPDSSLPHSCAPWRAVRRRNRSRRRTGAGLCVECSGRLLSWEDCFERAAEVCKGESYDVFTRVGEQSALVAAEPQHLSSSTTTSRSMVIACKRS